MRAPRTAIGRGVIAGIAGATVIAIWFLLGDLRQGEPFRTPLLLAGMIGLDGIQSPALTVTLYTMLHYAALILISIGVAWGVEFITSAPIMLLGLVLGFLLFDMIFYGSIMVTGINVAAELGWPRVLIGNLLAGVTIFGVLALTGAVEPLNWRTVLAEHYTIREGLLAGLIGAAVVAGWFLLVDALSGRLLFTPAALGSAVFLGTRGVEAVEISAATVLGYTAIHLAAFLLIGLVAAGIVGAAEEQSEAILLGGVLLFVTFEVLSIGLVTILASWLVDALQWWNIAAANLLAAATMGAFLLLRHPDLLRDMRDRNLEEDLAHDTVAPGHRAPH
jgi:hypothetical protein